MALQVVDKRLKRPDGIGWWQLIRLGLKYFYHAQSSTFDVYSICLAGDVIAVCIVQFKWSLQKLEWQNLVNKANTWFWFMNTPCLWAPEFPCTFYCHIPDITQQAAGPMHFGLSNPDLWSQQGPAGWGLYLKALLRTRPCIRMVWFKSSLQFFFINCPPISMNNRGYDV